MSLQHCHCTEWNWCRANREESYAETLWICLNRKRPEVLVPGTEKLYCYWKIGIYLEISKKRLDLVVPPEWRTIARETLEDWTKRLRERPYEDIILGETYYRWLPHGLIPNGQRIVDIPLAGRDGWPVIEEEVPYFDAPLLEYSDGTELFIRTDRVVPRDIVKGMEKIFCYWRIELEHLNGHKFFVWVPPEWRRLTKTALSKWKKLLWEHSGHSWLPIVLGGCQYVWREDTIFPASQDTTEIYSQGYGLFNYRAPEDTDEEEEETEYEEGCDPEPFLNRANDLIFGSDRWEAADEFNWQQPEKFSKLEHDREVAEICRMCKELGVEIITNDTKIEDEKKELKTFGKARVEDESI